ncbi:unnamed protein product [Clonostachys byssicola]|uniref:NmrA-like domain-containing protein n=1 Tax=Clonostachys byssicola TaxID=160290 RepID=A0A9N9U940_9HYPO|nr:unnamed protein product [Clonostachys byssicola]
MSPPTIIVFGATGHVGSAAAIQAQQLGAKVILSVRDLQKPIHDLSLEEETSRGFERVQADLTQPETVESAVRSTGAKHAFIYLVRSKEGYLRSTIETLKLAGIEFVVFLSSYTVQGDIRKITPSYLVPYAHAQVEIHLEEVFGSHGYVAIRPGYFNTNAARWASMIREGEVKISYPDVKFDWITPADVGRAAGTVLVQGKHVTEGAEPRNSISVYGPKLLSQMEAIGIFSRVLGKDIKVTEQSDEEAVEYMMKAGMPPPLAQQMVTLLAGFKLNSEAHEEAVANFQKYTGQLTTLEEWAQANKVLIGG